jgi:hypothetical protein
LKAGSDFAQKNGRKYGIGTNEFVSPIDLLLRNLLEITNQSSIRFDYDTAFILENSSFLAFVGKKRHRRASSSLPLQFLVRDHAYFLEFLIS